MVEALEHRTVPSFLAPVDYAVTSPGAIVAGDFNGDTRPDLAAMAVDSVSVLLGNPDGTFQAARTSPISQPPIWFEAGDFNRDGNLDLVTAHSSRVISIWPGRGDGTFDAAQSVSVPATPVAVAVGDFNADSNPDLAVTSNAVTGWITRPIPRCNPRRSSCTYRVPIYTNYANVLLGQGDGSFLPPNTTTGSRTRLDALAVGDFNEDAKLDLATDSGLWLGNGDGTLQSPISHAIDAYALELVAGDFNADGHLDLASANSESRPAITVLLGQGNGSFAPAMQHSLSGVLASSVPVSLVAGDLNADRQLDLVATSNGYECTSGLNWRWCAFDGSSLRVFVLQGQGDGTFTEEQFRLTGGALVGVAVGQFNGDGLADAAVAHAGSPVSVLINDGNWPSVAVSISDVTVTEGDHGTLDASFTVSLSAAPSQPVTVHYTTRNDTAAADIDYVATAGTLTFNPGDPLSRSIEVPIIGNTTDEPDRTFAVHLSMVSHASVRDSRGIGTILDNDPTPPPPPPPSILIEDASITEGKRGTKLLVFRVTLSAASANWVSVNYATADGTAKTGNNDYVAASGTLTFAPGQTEATVEVVIKGDKRKEGDETFAVNLSDAVDAVIADVQAIGTILNDDR